MVKSKSASSLRLPNNKRNKLKNNFEIDNKNYLKTNSNDSKRIRTKKEICKKFKKNPQFFYTEDLCNLVLKSFDIDENDDNKENINKTNNMNNCYKNKTQISLIDKKINMQAYYNLKQFFKENNLDD